MRVLAIFLVAFPMSGLLANESTRLERHQKAVQTLETTHFFKDGRGMVLPPNLIKAVDLSSYSKAFSEKGFARNRYGLRKFSKRKYRGLFNVRYQGANIGVLGCVFCHSGRAAGIEIPGLGNKNVDVAQIGSDLKKVYKLLGPLYKTFTKKPELQEMFKNSYEFAKVLSNPQFSNKTAGLVPISMIRYWFYKNSEFGVPKNLTSGAVKVPHFWGYNEKKKVGQFCDGGGNGNLPGWGAAVELAAGQKAQALRDTEYLHKLENIEEEIGHILPPKYPFTINRELAKRGEKLFANRCSKCHGSYQRDSQALPIFEAPKHIPIEVVKTDSDRLKGNTPLFYTLVEQNPIVDLLAANYFEPGYFAPRLEGIWARFPYLHNGSVPNLYQLLSHPDERSSVFSLYDAGELYRFDQKHVGLTVPAKTWPSKKGRSRTTYQTHLLGQSNKGHYNFETLAEKQKLDLIEYLKTL